MKTACYFQDLLSLTPESHFFAVLVFQVLERKMSREKSNSQTLTEFRNLDDIPLDNSIPSDRCSPWY